LCAVSSRTEPCSGLISSSRRCTYIRNRTKKRMSAYTEIICPYTTRQTQYKKYSPDTLTPPSNSYSPSLLLGTGISAHGTVTVFIPWDTEMSWEMYLLYTLKTTLQH
jgi:hypothetical protein